MELDVNSTVIDDELQVWAVHAGKNKKYFNEFKKHNSIFLDLPGLDFSSSVIENDQLLGCHILMAEAFQKHYRSNLSSEKPSQDPQSYFDHKSSSSSVRSSIYNVRTFSQDIKKGDLILSSPRRSYDPFLIGIVEDNFSEKSRLIIDPFLENEFTFRSVKWVSSYTSKHDLSASLAVRLENQRAITQIDRSIYGDECPSGKSLSHRNCL